MLLTQTYANILFNILYSKKLLRWQIVVLWCNITAWSLIPEEWAGSTSQNLPTLVGISDLENNGYYGYPLCVLLYENFVSFLYSINLPTGYGWNKGNLLKPSFLTSLLWGTVWAENKGKDNDTYKHTIVKSQRADTQASRRFSFFTVLQCINA